LNPDTAIHPIYVVSRGRAATCGTGRLLVTADLSFRLVVEPHERAAYALAFPQAKIVELPERDRGLAYARQHTLSHAMASWAGWFWMLDDDLTGLFEIVDSRCQRRSAGAVLGAASKTLDACTAQGQAALEYSQFAWSAAGRPKLNSYCDVCVAIHTRRTGGARFRPETGVKVDRDFTLQVLASGWQTIRLTRWAFAAPENGSNAGGLCEEYQTDGREAAASQKMAEFWGPQICRPRTKRNGRPDVEINWRYFQPERAAAATAAQTPHQSARSRRREPAPTDPSNSGDAPSPRRGRPR
jgi:hypothetical protein